MTNFKRIENLERLPREELRVLLETHTPEDAEYLFMRARKIREQAYGKAVYLRGLVEISSYCKNDCLYCGLRRGNHRAQRYRLGREEILACCEKGHAFGLRTFVLQGGEDPWFDDGRLCDIVSEIRDSYSDCAITLSLGERGRESYEALFAAGADRYLLRHETANEKHYKLLHPSELTLQTRLRCLRDLREIGYQVGCGFMVGSPGQTIDCLLDDLEFLRAFRPEMVGIGPFLPHGDTPFAKEPPGSPELTLFLLGMVRVLLPGVLLPATTALGTAARNGREQGLLAGANVIMPNISPDYVRDKYMIYEGKDTRGMEGLRERIEAMGLEIGTGRGDAIAMNNEKLTMNNGGNSEI